MADQVGGGGDSGLEQEVVVKEICFPKRSWLEEDDRLPRDRRAVWEFVGHGRQQG